MAHGYLFDIKITVTPIPFTLIGLPLAIFLGFRNNTAYDRYWEGRKLWGDLSIRARVLARQCLSLIRMEQPLDPHNREGDVRIVRTARWPMPMRCVRSCVTMSMTAPWSAG